MKQEDFEKPVLQRGLIPLEAVVNMQGEVKWFIARNKDNFLVFDADGYAYSAPAEPDAVDFVFSGEVPKYHGHAMTFDPHHNLIF